MDKKKSRSKKNIVALPSQSLDVEVKENTTGAGAQDGLYDNLIPKHPNRKRVYDKFYKLFMAYGDKSHLDFQKMALNIERGIFNTVMASRLTGASIDWDDIFKIFYINKSVCIYRNLDPTNSLKNINLINRLFNKEFNEFQLTTMTPEELFPERHAEILAECKKLEPKTQKEEEMEDGAYKCGKCAGQKRPAYKTTYYQMQTRSAKIIGWKSILLITYWLCYWKNSCSPILILRC